MKIDGECLQKSNFSSFSTENLTKFGDERYKFEIFLRNSTRYFVSTLYCDHGALLIRARGGANMCEAFVALLSAVLGIFYYLY